MPHHRQLIREAVKAALVDATDAGTRVYETRDLPLSRLDLPAIAIYTLDENVVPESAVSAPRELTRQLQVAIEAWVSAAGDVDDAMDSIALAIETALDTDVYLGGVVGDSHILSTSMEVAPSGDRLMGLVTLTYQVIYRTISSRAAAQPEELGLEDFESVHARFDIAAGEQADADRTSDIFTTEEA